MVWPVCRLARGAYRWHRRLRESESAVAENPRGRRDRGPPVFGVPGICFLDNPDAITSRATASITGSKPCVTRPSVAYVPVGFRNSVSLRGSVGA